MLRQLTRQKKLVAIGKERWALPTSASSQDLVVGQLRMHRDGYTLLTASGESSWELDGYLTAMRVRACFNGCLYGPDQVDAAKMSPLYYERVFAHASITPGDTLVVDDSEQALNWAAELGAQTVLCNPKPPQNPRHHHVSRLAELPRLLGDPDS